MVQAKRDGRAVRSSEISSGKRNHRLLAYPSGSDSGDRLMPQFLLRVEGVSLVNVIDDTDDLSTAPGAG